MPNEALLPIILIVAFFAAFIFGLAYAQWNTRGLRRPILELKN